LLHLPVIKIIKIALEEVAIIDKYATGRDIPGGGNRCSKHVGLGPNLAGLA
jgi:hypothetical protein